MHSVRRNEDEDGRRPVVPEPAVQGLTGFYCVDLLEIDERCLFTSWLALAPNNKESAGRIFRRATPMSSSRAAKLFRLAACAVRNTQTALGAFYRRIRSRRGAPKAITATARKIATIYFRMLATGEEFIELGQDAYERQYQQRLLSNLRRKATRLGFSLVPDQSIS